MNSKSTPRLLLVEDNDIDAEVVERVLTRLRPDIEMERAGNGHEALLAARDKRPDLILLDIRMPQMDGRETLANLKGDETLCDIPVVMMSTSAHDEDIRFCNDHHANAYLTKSADPKTTRDAIENLLRFWFDKAVMQTARLH